MTVVDASAVVEMVLRTPIGERSPARLLADLPLSRYPHGPLLGRAWELRQSMSAYDAVHVALAEALEADTRVL